MGLTLSFVSDVQIKFTTATEQIGIFRLRPIADAIDGALDGIIINFIAGRLHHLRIQNYAVDQQPKSHGHFRPTGYRVGNIGTIPNQLGNLVGVVRLRRVAYARGSIAAECR